MKNKYIDEDDGNIWKYLYFSLDREYLFERLDTLQRN